MSELFAVRVVDVTRESARLQVRSVHPDSGPPAPRAVFALMLLFDPILNSGYSAFRRYTHLEGSPLAQAMDRDNYLDPTWLRTHARAFVTKAKVSGGVLEVWPTHPGWISHLRKGMAWDTAAYDGGPGLPAAPRAPATTAAARRVDEPAAGFRVGRPKNEEYAIAAAYIPRHGPNRYLADPEISDPAAMQAAVKTMIGQPLLVVPKRGPSQIGTLVELRDSGMFIYYETEYGYGGSGLDFSELKSIGRAWLKQGEPASEPAKTAAKQATAEKATAKKATAKKATSKTATSKTATAKKTTAKKTTAKKTTAKKTTAKKTAAKKTAAKKAPAKKAAARKAPAKKAAKKSTAKKAARKASRRA